MTPTQTGDKPMVTLAQCPIGLFMAGDELCLKTEYGNNEGRIDAYIVSSGEFFWGTAPQTIANQRMQMVEPIDAEALLARHREQETREQPLDTIQRLGQEFDAPEASPSLGMGEAHGDRKCDACHRANPVWFAPSPLWNIVIGGPEATDDPGGVLCPICFIEKAEAAGIMPATGAWLVTKEPAASLTSPSPDLAEEND